MTAVVINKEATVAYLRKSKSAVSLGNQKEGKTGSVTVPVQKDTNAGSDPWAKWGEDNLFPQTVFEEARANTIVGSTLDWKARALYSGGLFYGQVTGYDESGNEQFKPLVDPEIEKFKKLSNLNRYLIEACGDFYWFYNVFPEMVLASDRSKILQLQIQEAMFCRWEKQNEKSGIVENCYISANWDKRPPKDTIDKIAVIDPYAYDPVSTAKGRKEFKYIYPVSYPTPGKVYYQLAHWDSIRASKWLEVMKLIPEFKKFLFENQITVKHQIEVATDFWFWKYPEWEGLDVDTRVKLMTKELEEIDTQLAGNGNAGKSFMTHTYIDKVRGVSFPYVKITAVDNRIKDGMYIEDSQEGSSHLLYAMSVDPTIIGSAPGKGMGGGSGSDKREAFNMYISLCEIHAHCILEPLHFIADYNGWSDRLPGLQFRFRRPILQTLDKVTPSKRQTTPAQ